MATKTYNAGDILIAEGTVPRRAYRIAEGSVELTRLVDGTPMPTSVLDRGALVGADELLDGTPMADTAQALGALTVEELSVEQAAQLLRRKPKTAPAKPPRPERGRGEPSSSRALVALSSLAETDYTNDDPASSVLKPGLLRRLLKPEFADLHDRLDIRVAPLEGEAGETATQELLAELNKRRGLRARPMNVRVAFNGGADPVRAMAELRNAAGRWLADNDGDVLLWGEARAHSGPVHVRFFVTDEKPVDQFRIGDGWTLLTLPRPLDVSAAHRLHAAVLTAVRTRAAGKLLTVKRDLDVLLDDARDHLLAEAPGLEPLERAEDCAARGRIFANVSRLKRRADDARAAIEMIDRALTLFSLDNTPVEWALAHRDRAFLKQFVAERANDTDALRDSIADVECALRVIGPRLFAEDWAALNDRMGLALYRLDFDSGDAVILERALQAFQNALTVYDKRKTPIEWAEAMAHFGQVALIIGREHRDPAMLLRAVESCNAVVSVRDRKHMPLHWASAQNNLGSALFLYGRIAGDGAALRGARDAFETAHAIYLEKGAERLARVTEKNLGHVDKALARRHRPRRSEPPELPWEPKPGEPPPLPWEFEIGDERS